MKKNISVLGVIAFIISCNANTSRNIVQYKSLGDSIAVQTQTELLKSISKAIADGGVAFAIDYCNINAETITNQSVDDKKIVSVQRLSDKNRNPNNQILSKEDRVAFDYVKAQGKDTIFYSNKEIIYYKPIKIMMPTCLKCHGNKNEIEPSVYENIVSKYPKDLAINYKQGDLRGMWKIKIKE